MYRIEKDSIGQKQIPADVLYGIHAARAKENFPVNTLFPIEWYKAVGVTKLACYNTFRKFRDAATEKYGKDLPVKMISDNVLNALCEAAEGVAEGRYFEYFIVPAVQGGAGTSINMNINEIIANAALLKTGKKCGDYNFIDPVEHANIFQSTNDVMVSSLSGQGCMELNAYIPVIGNAIIESINLLISADSTLLNNLFTGLVINEESGYNALINSPSVTTALSPHIGYHKASELAALMKEKKINIFEANFMLNIIDEKRLTSLLNPANLLKLGFSLEDFTNK